MSLGVEGRRGVVDGDIEEPFCGRGRGITDVDVERGGCRGMKGVNDSS